ncbi:hypothetical protein Hypma_003229 [Hypsizygus marmoreus]|uniref:Uncharacterized protein n=1 Tax=Hypsizygus marmoreus TaxID=39966 RepID=A0A369K7J1_HYPMA|nr:hypothetical protein Hypma_003229 [Hypsizygus marmoreus]
MGLNTEASAALVFLILYAILFVILILGHITGRLRLRSRYSIITFHVAIRLASQATGLAFGIVGYEATDLLVAYFILGAEGYFTLVLCTYRFLISWHYHNLESHDSWLEPRDPPGTPWYKPFIESLTLFGKKRRPMAVLHYLLIAANAIIISGGSQLAGGSKSVKDFNSSLLQAKIMRVVGQSIFLAINSFLLFCIFDALRQYKTEHQSRKGHPTLYVLLATWPLLFIRGLYGILSGVIPALNYFNPDNYGEHGLTNSFVISEYILSTTTEWASCALLMLTYLTSRNDPSKLPLKEWTDAGKEVAQDKGAAETGEKGHTGSRPDISI